MTENSHLMSTISDAVMRGRGGDTDGAKTDLHELVEAIIWDELALAAATENPDRTDGFLPPLHLNIADNRRRLGNFDVAAQHLDLARKSLPSLDGGPYAEQMERWIGDVHSLNDAHLTSPLPTEGD